MLAKIVSKLSYDVATFGNFSGRTDANYSKLLQISRVVSSISAAAYDDQFCIAEYSSPLYSTEQSLTDHPGEFVVLASKDVSADSFWDYLWRLKRPTVFYRESTQLRWDSSVVMPLYSAVDSEALKIVSATVETPVHISFEGVAKIIRQMFHGGADERRREEKHKAEMEGLEMENWERKARVGRELLSLAEDVQRSSVSPHYKKKILSIVDGVSDGQRMLNDRLGASVQLKSQPREQAPRQLPRRRH